MSETLFCDACKQDHSKDLITWCDRSNLEIKYEKLQQENEQLKAVIRQDEINHTELLDKSQEAAHYNWLDDINTKLKADNKIMRDALETISDIGSAFKSDKVLVVNRGSYSDFELRRIAKEALEKVNK